MSAVVETERSYPPRYAVKHLIECVDNRRRWMAIARHDDLREAIAWAKRSGESGLAIFDGRSKVCP